MAEPLSILVCGGRTFTNDRRVFAELDRLNMSRSVGLVIAGDAKGADALALRWAFDRGVPSLCFTAEWDQHGKAAGPIRNQEMLDQHPDVVVAFPGGRGTADMTRRAHAAGVQIIYA